MKKEVVIAIFLGIIIGLIITFGVHRAQQSLKTRDLEQQKNTTESHQESNPNTTSPHSLIIYSPEENTIYDQEEIQVSGITTEGALISVIRGSQFSTTHADSNGSFATTITLKPGANRVVVSSHSLEGTIASSSSDIVYSTADLTEKEPTTPDSNVDEAGEDSNEQ